MTNKRWADFLYTETGGKRYRQAYKNRRRQLRLAGVPAPLLVALRTHFYGKGTS